MATAIHSMLDETQESVVVNNKIRGTQHQYDRLTPRQALIMCWLHFAKNNWHDDQFAYLTEKYGDRVQITNDFRTAFIGTEFWVDLEEPESI